MKIRVKSEEYLLANGWETEDGPDRVAGTELICRSIDFFGKPAFETEDNGIFLASEVDVLEN